MSTMTPATPGAPTDPQLNRLRAVYRRRGWAIWHGNATGQYWAAHTKQMVLLSGDSAQELQARIERLEQSSRPAKTTFSHLVRARRTGAVRLSPRPKPRGYRHRPGLREGPARHPVTRSSTIRSTAASAVWPAPSSVSEAAPVQSP